jgi:hypothetical protein
MPSDAVHTIHCSMDEQHGNWHHIRTLGVQLLHPSIGPHGEALERLAAIGTTKTDVSRALDALACKACKSCTGNYACKLHATPTTLIVQHQPVRQCVDQHFIEDVVHDSAEERHAG